MDYYFYTKQLAVGYDGRPLIRDIEIRLQRGQILTLIGPNGAGKSTILKSIARYLKLVYGGVYLGGRSLAEMGSAELSRELSVVLTERLRTEMMTCQDVVETGRYPYTGRFGRLTPEDRRIVRETMEQIHVWELRGDDFGRISDGQRQRVLLARAIAQQPQIIVLDEPTTFLDIHHQLELLSLLREMADTRRIAVILSLHELDLAQKISDIVLCVKGDTIAHWGPPQEIFRAGLISELYGLESGSYNPLFGSVELPAPQGRPQVFVIAGGGAGIPVYRQLQRRGIPFSTGVLHENDIDRQVAEALAAETILEKSFTPIRPETCEKAKAALGRCRCVIHCLREYGEMNERNRALCEYARALGLPIYDSAEDLPSFGAAPAETGGIASPVSAALPPSRT